MRLVFVYNVDMGRGDIDVGDDSPEQIERWIRSLSRFGQVTAVELMNPTDVLYELSGGASGQRPDLVVNMSEARFGTYKEAFLPMLCDALELPHTLSDARGFLLTQDKALAKSEVERLGAMKVPRGVTVHDRAIEEGLASAGGLRYPLIVKPVYNGASEGIYADSVVEDAESLERQVRDLLSDWPGSVLVEEYIRGVDVFVPYLESYRESDTCGVAHPEVLEPYEIYVDKKHLGNRKFFTYDFEFKTTYDHLVQVRTPLSFPPNVIEDIRARCAAIYRGLDIRDVGRIDLRVTEDGTPYFLELNAMPALAEGGEFQQAAYRRGGLDYDGVIGAIVRSAMRRHGLTAESREAEKTEAHSGR